MSKFFAPLTPVPRHPEQAAASQQVAGERVRDGGDGQDERGRQGELPLNYSDERNTHKEQRNILEKIKLLSYFKIIKTIPRYFVKSY